MLKKCTKCQGEYPLGLEYFEPRKESKDGYRNECRQCRRARKREIYDEKYKSDNNRKWTQYEIDILKKYYENMSNIDIHNIYLKNRSIAQITDYGTKKLKLHKNKRFKIYTVKNIYIDKNQTDGGIDRSVTIGYGWDEKDDQYLIDNYADSSFEEMVEYLNKKKFTIIARAIKLGIKKSRKFSEYEIDIIKKYYSYKENQWIIDNFMPNKTTTDIVGKANSLGIKKNDRLIYEIRTRNGLGNLQYVPDQTGSNSPRWRDGASTLRIYIRNHIKKWHKDSLEFYSNECFITKDIDNIVVHHLYPFKDILDEVLDELNLKYCNDLTSYSSKELRDIIDLSNKKHYEFGLGIPIRRDLHLQFHKIYGFVGYTYENLLEFKDKYNKNMLQ